MTKLITETSEIEQVEVHSDAGGKGHKITCPNCKLTVVFASGGWWRNECACGEWDLELKATLEPIDQKG